MAEIQTKRTVKQHNQKAVLALLRDTSPTTIPEIAGRMRLSNNTVTKIIDHYIKEDLVVASGKGESTYEGGKRPNLYAFNPRASYAVGIQIAHEGLIHAVLTDLNGKVHRKVALPWRWNTEIENILNSIATAYRRLLEEERIDESRIVGFALGTHGITDYEQGTILVSPHNPVWGKDVPIKNMLREFIGADVPVFVDNQIRFKVFAEQSLGVGRGFENIFILYSGISAIAGIVSDNHIKRGKHHLAGSIGHMTLDPGDEEVCMCGGRGCLGVLIDINRVLRKAAEEHAKYPGSLVFEKNSPKSIAIEDVFKASNQGDPLAQELMNEVIKWFAAGIHNAILFYDPDIVIIQGVYAQAGAYFIDNLRRRVNEVSLLQIPIDVRIEYSQLGSKVGAVGAASFAIHQFFG